jgi:hypothetical protein
MNYIFTRLVPQPINGKTYLIGRYPSLEAVPPGPGVPFLASADAITFDVLPK